MSFDNPAFLYLFFLFIAFIPLTILRYRKSREGAALFAATAPSNERKSLLRELRLRMLLSDIFFIFFVGFLLFALSGPRWGVRLVADYRRGVDVVLAFDLSRSMNVLDAHRGGSDYISRLDLGAEIASDLVSSLGEVRVGAAISKGRGVLALPLTYDTETINAFLISLNTDIISGSGTNLEALVDTAASAFDDTIPSRRRIIVFSDGEGLTGSFRSAVDRARRAGISVSAIGLGSEQGGLVPVQSGPNAPEGFLLGSDGRPVVSSREADTLRNGVERSGGIYIDGSRTDTFRVLSAYINSLATESSLAGHRREPNPRWRIFVLAAIVCLALSRLMGFSHKDMSVKNLKKGGAVLASILCMLVFNSCSGVSSRLLVMEGNFFKNRGYYTEAISSYLRALSYEDAAPYAEYGLGIAFFALEEDIAALERYRNVERSIMHDRVNHPELLFRSIYNIGIILFQQGEYSDAANAFREALIIDGSRIEAKRNLELSLLTMTAMTTPQTTDLQEGAEAGMVSRSRGSGAIMEYLREQEREQWRSREWSEEGEPSALDY
ncbi:MAG: tetratricopeptide repeat protein [Treponema sp.]|nr:tetratricopeptide repeat protein [Treponema sp.]